MENALKYEAIMLGADGDSVRDYGSESMEEVWHNVDNGGSRWYFYPFAVVVRYGADKRSGRIIDTPEAWAHWRGKSIGRLIARIREEYAFNEHDDKYTAEDMFLAIGAQVAQHFRRVALRLSQRAHQPDCQLQDSSLKIEYDKITEERRISRL